MIDESSRVERERFINAILFTILLIGVLFAVVSALPLKKAYPVKLSSDISAILVKSGPRTLADVVPESLMSKTLVDPEWAKNPLQKQAVLNAYGAALTLLGEKTKQGYIITKSEIEGDEVGKVLTASKLEYQDGREVVWVNNTKFPDIEVPSILAGAQGNSDTVALALYFVEVMTGEVWSNKYHFKITGAMSDPMDRDLVTSIGSANDKAKIEVGEDEFLYMPLSNRYELESPRQKIRFMTSLSSIIGEICSLPERGALCSNKKIVPIIERENVRSESNRVLSSLSEKSFNK